MAKSPDNGLAGAATKPPNGMDEGTLIAIVSLIISILSTLVCIGQVMQQYAGTAQAIRLCDGIVYGGRNGLPGRGRRCWLWRQFRFRIIYEIPQISLTPLPPTVGMFVPYMIKPSPSFDWPPPEQKLMSQLSNFDAKNSIGEASWVAFCRVLLQACPASVIVNRISGDTDRCPSDMTNIPMPVSLRDIAIFCLFVGMECTSASFTSGTIAMSGPIGSVTSSEHPTLGSCIHFAPPQDGFRLGKIGTKIDTHWILRACGRLRVGNVILQIGDERQAQNGTTSSFEDEQLMWGEVKSPFDDEYAEDYDSPTFGKSEQKRRMDGDVNIIVVQSLSFYWLLQINVVPGFWASPFKTSAHRQIGMYWGCQQVVLRAFAELFNHSMPSGSYPLSYWTPANTPEVLCGSGIITYPPYGVRHGANGEMMNKGTIEAFASRHQHVQCAQFDGHIPRLMVRREGMSPAAHSRLDDHYLCSVELMSIDVWLGVVSKTVPIMAGRNQILSRVPDMLQEIAAAMSTAWEDAYYGNRSKVDDCSTKLRQYLEDKQLTGAEKMYLLVAMLRTAKAALCIALGNDSSALLEIIEKDVQAHLL